jgi:hypothetical protein
MCFSRDIVSRSHLLTLVISILSSETDFFRLRVTYEEIANSSHDPPNKVCAIPF